MDGERHFFFTVRRKLTRSNSLKLTTAQLTKLGLNLWVYKGGREGKTGREREGGRGREGEGGRVERGRE